MGMLYDATVRDLFATIERKDREYEALSKERFALMYDNIKLRRMLKTALEALNGMAENVREECGESACGLCEHDSPLNEYGEMIYECAGVNGKTDCFKWKHYDEAMELLGEKGEVII